ncbi:MAG: polysaccharide export protein [Desulfobulbaceae bacterium]|nr:polysaccharide export protein [Desulfobulbaceae bacterium]
MGTIKAGWGIAMMWRVLAVVLAGFAFFSPTGIACALEYAVGEGDVLEISVYDNPDLLTTVRVSGGGDITVQLLGQVMVDGKSPEQVAKQLEALYADGYLVSPQVHVFVKEYRSQKATILGQVKIPGLCELHGPTTLLELISKAGGLSENAGNQATIKRKALGGTGKDEVITVDMKQLIEVGDTSLNIPILDGDSIYISKSGMFFVTGEVSRPASYKYEEESTVIKAISVAGGFTDKAAHDKVRIIRKEGGKENVLEKVKMDTPIKPDDVIVVPESFF